MSERGKYGRDCAAKSGGGSNVALAIGVGFAALVGVSIFSAASAAKRTHKVRERIAAKEEKLLPFVGASSEQDRKNREAIFGKLIR